MGKIRRDGRKGSVSPASPAASSSSAVIFALLGSSLASLFSAFIPALVILMAIPLLGEMPGPLEWMGIALATCGMILALGRRR